MSFLYQIRYYTIYLYQWKKLIIFNCIFLNYKLTSQKVIQANMKFLEFTLHVFNQKQKEYMLITEKEKNGFTETDLRLSLNFSARFAAASKILLNFRYRNHRVKPVKFHNYLNVWNSSPIPRRKIIRVSSTFQRYSFRLESA